MFYGTAGSRRVALPARKSHTFLVRRCRILGRILSTLSIPDLPTGEKDSAILPKSQENENHMPCITHFSPGSGNPGCSTRPDFCSLAFCSYRH